jgi:hypothetical protein
MKWLGSYRYAVFNVGGMSNHDLLDRYRMLRNQVRLELA